MSKDDDLLKKAAIKEGERILGLLHEPDREKIIAWRAATTVTKQVTVMPEEQAQALGFICGVVGLFIAIINVIFIASRPEGWPITCSLEHKESIRWQIGCEEGVLRCNESNETVYFVANVGDWKCKTNDKRHFSCEDIAKLPNEF